MHYATWKLPGFALTKILPSPSVRDEVRKKKREVNFDWKELMPFSI